MRNPAVCAEVRSYGTHPEMAYYIKEGRDFTNDVVTFNAETESYEATFTGDNQSTRRSWTSPMARSSCSCCRKDSSRAARSRASIRIYN